jgi:hypothetical protein
MFPSPTKWFNALLSGAAICTEASHCLKSAITRCSPGFPLQQFVLTTLSGGMMRVAMIDEYYEN